MVLRILIVDDASFIRDRVKKHLREGLVLRFVDQDANKYEALSRDIAEV